MISEAVTEEKTRPKEYLTYWTNEYIHEEYHSEIRAINDADR